MKTLHKIFSGLTEAYVWTNISGGNGAAITKFSHLFLIERGTPPAITDGRRYRRSGWSPWGGGYSYLGMNAEILLTPLCGRVKSKSKWPMLNGAYTATWQEVNECPECKRIALNRGDPPKYLYDMQTKDPWNKIDYYSKETTTDPVSGL